MSNQPMGPPDVRDTLAVTGSKKQLRVRVLADRTAQSDRQRVAADHKRLALLMVLLDELAQQRAVDSPAIRPTVAIYLSAPPEPRTTGLASRLHWAGWHVIVPSPGRDGRPWAQPAWARYGEPLRPGPRGIPVVPDDMALADLADADVIVMPGLAGSLDGGRLGYGGAWYDRALLAAAPAAPRWLLLNDDEVVEAVPREDHDMTVDVIVTPSGVWPCRHA